MIQGINTIELGDVFYQAIKLVTNLTYAAVNYPPTKMLPIVQLILQQLKDYLQMYAAKFPWGVLAQQLNCAIINAYTQDKDYMGPHSDNNWYIGCNYLIVIISFGATRQFELRENSKKGNKLDSTTIQSGDIIIMYGKSVQQKFKHAVPKCKAGGHRISVSFRYHIKNKKN